LQVPEALAIGRSGLLIPVSQPEVLLSLEFQEIGLHNQAQRMPDTSPLGTDKQ
jgi:hypothetical protein